MCSTVAKDLDRPYSTQLNKTMTSTPKKRVLILGPIESTLPAYQKFLKEFEVIDYRATSRTQLITDLQEGGPLHGSIHAIYAAWAGLTKVGELDSELLDHFPTQELRIVTVCSAGFSPHWDLKKLRSLDVDFCNTPTFGAAQVADLALSFVLDGFRKLVVLDKITRRIGNTYTVREDLAFNLRWDRESGQYVKKIADGEDGENEVDFAFGHDLGGVNLITPQGKFAVILGFGSIGKLVGLRLNAIGMNVRYVKRTKLIKEEEEKLGYKAEYFSELKDAVKNASVVVLCLPGTVDTFRIINEQIIDLFNHTILVNVGRGSLIDEKAVLNGLRKGKISHFGADVYPEEPHINPELRQREDVTFTPHVGSSTEENDNATAKFCLENITDVLLHGKAAKNVQN
ncbi:unnamed protein product [Ambrosiozyma monospora]|uniref:Unnamed protein product n=1 Tax=Ambrosiozyma monospora TaxID=43982 RepID=A0A9W6YYY9_AMBMO|nr:unnamed protein product [Ambrosiozyma monospora]